MTNNSQHDEDALFNIWLENMTMRLIKEENNLNNNPAASVEVKTWLNKAIGIFQKTKEINKEKENKENIQRSYTASKEMVEFSIWQLHEIVGIYEKLNHPEKKFLKKCVDDMEKCLKGYISREDLHSNWQEAIRISDDAQLAYAHVYDTKGEVIFQLLIFLANSIRSIAFMCRAEDSGSIYNKVVNGRVTDSYTEAYNYFKVKGNHDEALQLLRKRDIKYTEIFNAPPPESYNKLYFIQY